MEVLLLNLGSRSSIYDRSTKQKKFTYTNKDGKEIEYKTSGVNYELNISKDNVQKFNNKTCTCFKSFIELEFNLT